MIEEVPLAHSWRRVDFEGGSATAIAIAWGDIATAWFSTGIPNIETYAKVPFAIAIAGPAVELVTSEHSGHLAALRQHLTQAVPGSLLDQSPIFLLANSSTLS